jgi:hypothetical protein
MTNHSSKVKNFLRTKPLLFCRVSEALGKAYKTLDEVFVECDT